ncbi:unnamed protein product [Amoebophrya sp. A25]|nr:unnamed protein product [Amoebophrya sp. A25]|eukprot:GSA25T00025535001.1
MTSEWWEDTTWQYAISQVEVVHVADYQLFLSDPVAFPLVPEDIQRATNRNPGVEFSEWMMQAMRARAEVAQSIADNTFHADKHLQAFVSTWRGDLFFREWSLQPRDTVEKIEFTHDWFHVDPIQRNSLARQVFDKMFGVYLQRLYWRAHVEEDQFRSLIPGDKKMMELGGHPLVGNSFQYSQECYDYLQDAWLRRQALIQQAEKNADQQKAEEEKDAAPSPDPKIRRRDGGPELGLYTIQEGSQEGEEQAGENEEAQQGPASLEDFNFDNQNNLQGQARASSRRH